VSPVVIIVLALLAMLLVGIFAGLFYFGFLIIGDRRGLGVRTHQLRAEQRMQAATHQTLAEMRAAARRFGP
jgi:hypothetical protein